MPLSETDIRSKMNEAYQRFSQELAGERAGYLRAIADLEEILNEEIISKYFSSECEECPAQQKEGDMPSDSDFDILGTDQDNPCEVKTTRKKKSVHNEK